MLFANCHNHSTFSDGVHSPEKLVELAVKMGHKAIILTDHDTVRGDHFIRSAARKAGLLTLTGCEFSVLGPNNEDIHLLGLDFNAHNPQMQELLANGSGKQRERSRMLFEIGLEKGTLRSGITWNDVLERFPDHDYICNNHVFTLMMEKGIYTYDEYPEFFESTFRSTAESRAFIKANNPYKVPRIEYTIEVIKKAGGVPVVAHPQGFENIANDLISLGVMGFETRHPMLDDAEHKFFDDLCTNNNLYKMGGTDHSCVLGGFADRMPHYDVPPETGYVEEKDFMDLYYRRLG